MVKNVWLLSNSSLEKSVVPGNDDRWAVTVLVKERTPIEKELPSRENWLVQIKGFYNENSTKNHLTGTINGIK